MSAAEGTGLLAFRADIDPDYLLRFQEWHNCEHMPERVAIDGFVLGLRYRSVSQANRFLMCYRTRTPEVLSSPAYLAALDRPTEWTRESLTHFRQPNRSAYRLASAGGTEYAQPAPYLGTVRFEREPGDQVARVAATVGASSWRLYEVDTGATGVKTSERKIYGGTPGAERFLAWFELALPHAWRAVAGDAEHALGAEPASNRPGGDPASELFWLDFVVRPQRG
jgi:hypothetical protein